MSIFSNLSGTMDYSFQLGKKGTKFIYMKTSPSTKLQLVDVEDNTKFTELEVGVFTSHTTATVDDLNINGGLLLKQCSTITELRNTEPTYSNQIINLVEYNVGTGLGGGIMKSVSSTDAGGIEDDGVTLFKTAGGAIWKRTNADIITPLMAGAVGDGVTDDSYSFQKCASALKTSGGTIYIPTPKVEYRITYPVYIFSNTVLYGSGISCRIVFENPVYNKGRGGFVIGSSSEANRETALANYAAGTYPSSSTINKNFVNPQQKQYLRDNPQFIESENSTIHDVYIVAKYTGTTLNGGYGVNLVNSANCNVYNIWGEGWTQLIGMGSDTVPETPSNYNCHCWNLTVVTPNQSKTFYSIAFIANSTNCSIKNAKQLNPMLDGTPNGSGIATNLCEDIVVTDIKIPNLGRTNSSEGILINNTKGAYVDNIFIGNAKSACSAYYTDATYNDILKPNIFGNINTENCTYSLSLRSKFTTVDSVVGVNNTTTLYFGNSNATNNTIKFKPDSMAFGGSTFPSNYLQNNTVTGWIYQYKYLRSSDILMNDKSDTNGWDANFYVRTKKDVNLKFLYELPPYMRAVNDIRMFLTFNIGALTATSNMSISLRRMIAFDGNANTKPYIEMSNSRTATLDTLVDTTLVSQSTSTYPGYVLLSDTTNGLANAVDMYVEANNNVTNNFVKVFRIGYFGD